MDKSAIKNFAVNARVKLKGQIEQKAYTFGITKNEIKSVETFEDAFEVNGNRYDKRLLKHRESLVKKINEKGFDQVIEEVAYTWFNRLIAIRFMEVNEYLPSGVRVLSSTDSNKAEPDIIREAANLDFENLNVDLIYKLQDENNTEELFKYLFIKQCNELGKIMPVVFEKIEDYTELLLPDNLLQEGSIIRDLVTSITEEDWKEQVEIIGWLYQYYISEKKDEVFADLKKNKKITKENIPAATQLFTPDWIVKYMVENSLGRLWLESHPDDELKAKWKYYLEEAKQEPEVMKQLQVIRDENKDLKPEDIKFLDPCMGSGHILVYAFDVLYDIYKSSGYSEREIPKLILEKNLYGLDIDDRAVQLSYFAVMMKARSYSRRIFRKKIDLNVCSIQESNGFPKEAIDFFASGNESLKEDVEYLINVFNDAKEYGSILEVKGIDFDAIERRIEEIRNCDTTDLFELQYKNIILEKIPDLVKQAKIMSEKYDIVCTNPPYMGSNGMNKKLKDYVEKNYANSKSDLFSVFIEKCIIMTKTDGFTSMVTMHSWMFTGSFEKLRKRILGCTSLYAIVHLGMEAFDNIIGKVVQTVSFIARKHHISEFKPIGIRLVDFYDSRRYEKESQFFNLNNRYSNVKQLSFTKIPGTPIAYWVSNKTMSIFAEDKIDKYANSCTGMQTGDNAKFTRYWYEVNIYKTNICTQNNNCKWNMYNEGGNLQKWYGNHLSVVNWENNGEGIRNNRSSVIRNEAYYFKEGITWKRIGSSGIGLRYLPKNFIFDQSGDSLFPKDISNLKYFLAYFNSKVGEVFFKIVSPTINLTAGNIKNIPIIFPSNIGIKGHINELVDECIEMARDNWDLSEISWDFRKHILLCYKNDSLTLEESFNKFNCYSENQFNKLKENQEEINRIFIEIYGLQDELDSNVDDKEVTFKKANRIRDIKSFISYSVGCMFGRYSLDEECLIYAGGEFNSDRYKTFKVDIDNVIPITDDEYFEDDIVSRFVEFVKITFSEETLEENLDYIADTLGKKGNETSRQTIRRYFLKDFYRVSK
ncbi:N-6 DNA methylase [Clostridium ragsdalei P11]|uniref:site-specific DNA-methyltransferase (adenine-specific) n=1 Tax=Clostridium ragsdalei P11 TaxID=1353534 RepID=A0A1A6AWD4_9CLOT|nr:BREX-1 system adenine-specific DNA-methyltransferase PglX [Clostridium ragsdalei]OBR94396.1 N-6 DNA methylase [Clostridium ragsdalei P11]